MTSDNGRHYCEHEETLANLVACAAEQKRRDQRQTELIGTPSRFDYALGQRQHGTGLIGLVEDLSERVDEIHRALIADGRCGCNMPPPPSKLAVAGKWGAIAAVGAAIVEVVRGVVHILG